MGDPTHDRGPRKPLAARANRKWLLYALPAAVVGGVALGVTSTGVPRELGPRTGPPDTLRELRVPFPRTPLPVEPPTRYLRRAMAPAETPREREMRALADRYRVTRPLARTIYDAAVEEGVDPELAFRLIRVESVFDADAVGPGGALGLMQMMPGTARDIDPAMRTRAQVLEPRNNLRLGLTNLRNMLELFDGDVRLAVIAYNRGEVAVQRALRRGRDPENGYGARVLGPRAHGGRTYAGPGLLPRVEGAAPETLPSRP